MFVRVKKVGTYRYLQIAENRREGKRVKQTIIATLGRLDNPSASRNASAAGQTAVMACSSTPASPRSASTRTALPDARIRAPRRAPLKPFLLRPLAASPSRGGCGCAFR